MAPAQVTGSNRYAFLTPVAHMGAAGSALVRTAGMTSSSLPEVTDCDGSRLKSRAHSRVRRGYWAEDAQQLKRADQVDLVRHDHGHD